MITSEKPELVLIRGPPGAGKNYFANKNFYLTHKIISADDYMLDNFGNYKFDITKCFLAHKKCEEDTREFLKLGYNVVVCNTFFRVEYMEDYIKMTDKIRIIRLKSLFKNTHGVPIRKQEWFVVTFEDYPGEEIIESSENDTEYKGTHVPLWESQRDEYKGTHVPLWESQRDEYKGTHVPLWESQRDEYKGTHVPLWESQRDEYKGTHVPLWESQRDEYKGTHVPLWESQRDEYKGTHVPLWESQRDEYKGTHVPLWESQRDDYKDYLFTLILKDKSRKLTTFEKSNWIPLDDIISYVNTELYNKRFNSYQDHVRYLIGVLYFYGCPMTNEWVDMKICNNYMEEYNDNMNILVKNSKKIILNREQKNEINEQVIPNNVWKILNESFTKYPRDYVFADPDNMNQKINDKMFDSLIYNLLSDKYTNKLNYVLIKKIVVTYLFAKDESVLENTNLLSEIKKKMNIFEPDGFSILLSYYHPLTL